MTNSVIVVTPPDDTLLDGVRIALVDLAPDQTQIISDSLKEINNNNRVILYYWKMGNPVDWLLNIKPKADLIIFNADAQANGAIELIIGYMAAQSNSYYFGTLRDLNKVNDSVIYSKEDLKELLLTTLENYETQHSHR